MEAKQIYHVLKSIIEPIHAHNDQLVAIAKWIEAEFEYKPEKQGYPSEKEFLLHQPEGGHITTEDYLKQIGYLMPTSKELAAMSWNDKVKLMSDDLDKYAAATGMKQEDPLLKLKRGEITLEEYLNQNKHHDG